MSWFKRLFGAESSAPVAEVEKPVTSVARPQTAPGTRISYDPHLVARLLEDHKKLFAIFTEIATAAKERDYVSAVPILHKFKSELYNHLLLENTRFYIFLEHTLKTVDPASARISHEFKSEMDKIARVVEGFLNKYSVQPWTSEMLNSFPVDVEQVGKALAERIDREESTLYPLYEFCKLKG